MKKISIILVVLLWACKKDNYPGGELSSFIAIYDIRNMHKGTDVTLNEDNMYGASKLTGWVISDHSGNNLPSGLLMVEDNRRLSQLRGIAIQLGEAAADYKPGDSVVIDINGAVLKEVDGMLQLAGITTDKINKVASNRTLPINRVRNTQLLADPGRYESVLSVIVKAGYDPLPTPGEVLSGTKLLDDAFAKIPLVTNANAPFANTPLPGLANYYGILINSRVNADSIKSEFRLRNAGDLVLLNSGVVSTPIIITGFMNNPLGSTEANMEYIQLMATKDIDFTTSPYSLVTTNNANNSVPIGIPINGWATGQVRTYKFDLTSGAVTKGNYFYVGGTTRLINGVGSQLIPVEKMISPYDYNANNGKGFGNKTGNLLANSGNAFGIAVFNGTNVTVSSVPLDVVFTASGGSLYTEGPPALGYRIGNTDFYDIVNPITQASQPFYTSGSNTLNFGYATGAEGQFVMLGGVYSPALGRWTTARSQTNKELSVDSTIAAIEGVEGATLLKQ